MLRSRASSLGFVVLILGSNHLAAQPLGEGFDPARDWARFPKLFFRYGFRPEQAVRHTPQGLLFDLGAERGPGHVGMQSHPHELPGDFHIEVKYQFDTLPEKVNTGYGVMLGMQAIVGGPDGGASIVRGVFIQGQSCNAGRQIPLAKGTRFAGRRFPCTSRHGRMALRRVGAEMLYLLADTPDGELKELTRYPFPIKPVREVGLYADTGGAQTELKGRLYDFTVATAANVPPGKFEKGPVGIEYSPLPTPAELRQGPADQGNAPPIREVDETEAAPVPVRWLLPVVTFVLGLVLGLVLGRWWRIASGSASLADKQATEAVTPQPASGRTGPARRSGESRS